MTSFWWKDRRRISLKFTNLELLTKSRKVMIELRRSYLFLALLRRGQTNSLEGVWIVCCGLEDTTTLACFNDSSPTRKKTRMKFWMKLCFSMGSVTQMCIFRNATKHILFPVPICLQVYLFCLTSCSAHLNLVWAVSVYWRICDIISEILTKIIVIFKLELKVTET